MRKRKVVPVTFHYNLLLRAVRDCGLGEVEFAQQLLDRHHTMSDDKRSREMLGAGKSTASEDVNGGGDISTSSEVWI